MPFLRAILFPSEAERESRAAPALLVLRVVAGTAFMFHGSTKIRDPSGWMGPEATIPGIFQALAAVSEFCGGLAWILGLLTPIASLGIFCTMLVAISTHLSRGQPFVGKGGWEQAAVFAAIALVLGLGGPGRLSLDAWIGRNRTAR